MHPACEQPSSVLHVLRTALISPALQEVAHCRSMPRWCAFLSALLSAATLPAAHGAVKVHIQQDADKPDPAQIEAFVSSHKFHPSQDARGRRRLLDTLFVPDAQVPTTLSDALRNSGPDATVATSQPLSMAFNINNPLRGTLHGQQQQDYISNELLPALGSFLSRSIRVRHPHEARSLCQWHRCCWAMQCMWCGMVKCSNLSVHLDHVNFVTLGLFLQHPTWPTRV